MPRTHPQEFNILQHSSCGEIRASHIETDAEKSADAKTEPNPQAVMWQFKKFHIPQRKKTLLKNLGKEKVLHNQTATPSKRRTRNTIASNA